MEQPPQPLTRVLEATSSLDGVKPPRPFTSFIGREVEIAAIRNAFEQSQVRLVTLTGLGGVGKTRLAIQAAEELLRSYPAGVIWVDLAPVTDPAQVRTTLLRSLGIPEQPSVPNLERLRRALKNYRVLLVCDNFEHVVEAATILSGVIELCDGVDVLVTSREPLNLTLEHLVAVKPFESPIAGATGDILIHAPGVQLFVERARAARATLSPSTTDLEIAAEICRRVDGIPLAIELAAARIAHLSPASLLANMEPRLPMLTGGKRDTPARQQTMKRTIEWSFQMLDTAEQTLFRRLAIFSGGCTLVAADAVVASSGELERPVIEVIGTLVEKNLLRQVESDDGELRFKMFEIVHEFAWEELVASGELPTTGDAHAAWYLELAKQADSHHRGANEPAWLSTVEKDRENLTGALTWLEEHDDPDRFLHLASLLYRFWLVQGSVAEGREWFERSLTATGESHSGHRRMALVWAADLARVAGNPGAAIMMLDESRNISVGEDDQAALAQELGLRGIIALERGDLHSAEREMMASVRIARQQPVGTIAHRYLSATLGCLGEMARVQGDLDTATGILDEALLISRHQNDVGTVAWHLERLGAVARDNGNSRLAASRFLESAQLVQTLGHRRVDTTGLLLNIAVLCMVRNRPAEATRIAGTVKARLDESNTVLQLGGEQDLDFLLERLEGELGAEHFRAAWNEGLQIRLDSAVPVAIEVLKTIVDTKPLKKRLLTPRESEVLTLISHGLTDREIAERLGLSPRTVQRHVSGILDAFDVPTRSAAVAFALRNADLE